MRARELSNNPEKENYWTTSIHHSGKKREGVFPVLATAVQLVSPSGLDDYLDGGRSQNAAIRPLVRLPILLRKLDSELRTIRELKHKNSPTRGSALSQAFLGYRGLHGVSSELLKVSP